MPRILLIFIFFLSLLLSSCVERKAWHQCEGEIQGTFYHITYYSSENIEKEIRHELLRFNRSLNIFDSTSTISRINENKKTDVLSDTLFCNVFKRSMEISKITNGAFDITISPLVKLWGFNHAAIPEKVLQQEIDSVRNLVGWQKVRLKDGQIVKDDPRMRLDANAIAQGYTCDIIASLMSKKNIQNYLIEIGGEIRASGRNSRNELWHVGINRPVFDSLSTNNEIQEIVLLSDVSIGTSGNYHKFHKVDGRMVGHEIDPRTGIPVKNEILSASVIAPDCMTADALATASMILGADSALALCEREKGVEAYLIILEDTGKEKIRKTSGFDRYIEKQK